MRKGYVGFNIDSLLQSDLAKTVKFHHSGHPPEHDAVSHDIVLEHFVKVQDAIIYFPLPWYFRYLLIMVFR